MIGEDIVRIARSYIGQTEKPQNSGFSNEEFADKMELVGWDTGQAWCAYFAELVWKEAYSDQDSSQIQRINDLCSASAVTTYRQFKASTDYTVGTVPAPGAIAIWQHGKGWAGHAGIVTAVVDDKSFKSVEGNTNDKGGREGYIVAERTRLIRKPYSPAGLNLLGFIYPREV